MVFDKNPRDLVRYMLQNMVYDLSQHLIKRLKLDIFILIMVRLLRIRRDYTEILGILIIYFIVRYFD
jgi:hypothetical protein